MERETKVLRLLFRMAGDCRQCLQQGTEVFAGDSKYPLSPVASSESYPAPGGNVLQ